MRQPTGPQPEIPPPNPEDEAVKRDINQPWPTERGRGDEPEPSTPAETAEREMSPEQEARERRMMKLIMVTEGLEPEAALEIVANYRPEGFSQETEAEFSVLAEQYGLPISDIPEDERRLLLTVYNGHKEGRREATRDNIAEVLERSLHERIVKLALTRIDQLRESIGRSADLEELKGRLRQTMESLSAAAKGMRTQGDVEGGIDFQQVFDRFNALVSLKKRGKGEQVQQAFGAVFEEFQDFIEDEMVAYQIAKLEREGQAVSVEHVMQSVYGRSEEEIEQVKARNRENVAATIMDMTEQPYVTVEMIKELYRVNNDGIVPKKAAEFRQDADMIMSFGRARRLGLLGKDIDNEMAALVERANDLIDRDILSNMTDTRYQIEAASLHNDMLDIHPFDDRNGSTSLLFLELMMARKGVTPPAERESDYYRKLRKMLGNNPAAVAVVGYEQMKMTVRPGYFQGETISEEDRKTYEKISRAVSERFRRKRRLADERRKAERSKMSKRDQ